MRVALHSSYLTAERLEAAAEDLLGRGDDDEGVGVFLADEGLELGHFGDGDGDHQDLAVLLGVHAAAVQGGDAAAQVLEDAVGDGLGLAGDDEGEELLAAGPLPATEVERIRARWRQVASPSWEGQV